MSHMSPTVIELVDHDLAGGVGHVERGVLARVGWGDDRHQVEPVRRVDLNIQNKGHH